MSKIVLFGNQKGGVGKTTLTALTAAALSADPFLKSVYVADLDNQKSLYKRREADLLSSINPAYQITAKTISELLESLNELDALHDFIFIDSAGKLDANLPIEQQEITRLLLVADVVLIPLVAGNFVLESTLDYLTLAFKVKAKRAINRPLEIVCFVNMAEPRTNEDKQLITDIEQLKGLLPSLRVMDRALNRYALFRSADTITSIYGSQDRAKANFKAWLDELFELLK